MVCPADIAKKVLEDAGYDYEGCLLYKGETVVNPYTGRKEKVLTWTTVGYLLKDKGIIIKIRVDNSPYFYYFCIKRKIFNFLF